MIGYLPFFGQTLVETSPGVYTPGLFQPPGVPIISEKTEGSLFEVGDTLRMLDMELRYLGADGDAILVQVINGGVFAQVMPPNSYAVYSTAILTPNAILALNFQAVAFDTVTGLAVGAPCFTRGTMIETRSGTVAIEDLRVGDMVMTSDNGLQPIRWIGASMITEAAFAATPKLRPILISAGALGDGLPAKDLRVSPQHRVLVRSKIAARMFGAAEVLVPAVKLLSLPGIYSDDDCDSVEYFHMLFDRHEIVRSNGAETESLHTGPVALMSLPAAARVEIFAIFPALAQIGAERELARPVPRGKDIAAMVERHKKNTKALQQAV